MPLDPQCDNVLKALESMGLPPLEAMTPEQLRGVFVPASFAALMGPPEEVAACTTRTIPGPGGDIPLMICTPAGQGPFPVLVYYHGGGWVCGTAELVDPVCRTLANGAGAIVVNVDYRLAPEHRYPAAADDCYAATKWVAEHAAEIGGDPRRVAVGGDSAGGNLAAVVALMARDRGGPELALQVLLYPVTDWEGEYPSRKENAEGYLLTWAAMPMFWGHYLPDTAARSQPYASPLQAPDLSGVAPALVLTCEFDPLRDEGEEYGERLRQAGVPTETKRYDGQIHGVFWMGAAVEKGREMIDHVVSALKKAFAR